MHTLFYSAVDEKMQVKCIRFVYHVVLHDGEVGELDMHTFFYLAVDEKTPLKCIRIVSHVFLHNGEVKDLNMFRCIPVRFGS